MENSQNCKKFCLWDGTRHFTNRVWKYMYKKFFADAIKSGKHFYGRVTNGHKNPVPLV